MRKSKAGIKPVDMDPIPRMGPTIRIVHNAAARHAKCGRFNQIDGTLNTRNNNHKTGKIMQKPVRYSYRSQE